MRPEVHSTTRSGTINFNHKYDSGPFDSSKYDSRLPDASKYDSGHSDAETAEPSLKIIVSALKPHSALNFDDVHNSTYEKKSDTDTRPPAS